MEGGDAFYRWNRGGAEKLLDYGETISRESEDEIGAIVCFQDDNAKACFPSAEYVKDSNPE